jgi:hypothetical protein
MGYLQAVNSGLPFVARNALLVSSLNALFNSLRPSSTLHQSLLLPKPKDYT